MSFVDVHVQAIEDCRQEAYKVRNMFVLDDAFEGTKSSAPKGDVSGDIFGKIEGAGALAKKVDAVWDSVTAEFSHGHSRMKSVEEALSTVAANFRGAEKGSGG
ncbi:hypothetical protein AB0I81_27975 [Nonomuraea sp. NPDC050404]|uniref:hypothetical protein n=1 Tax=Nonomuraea sp. NPDC050404 TaxID=3155783 RepID=UPI0033D3D7E7